MGRKRTVIYHWLVDTIPEIAATKCNVGSLYQARDCARSFKIQDALKFSFVTVQTRPLTK